MSDKMYGYTMKEYDDKARKMNSEVIGLNVKDTIDFVFSELTIEQKAKLGTLLYLYHMQGMEQGMKQGMKKGGKDV